MSTTTTTLLRLVIETPDLPLPTHLDRPVSVCFCGRPLPIARYVCDVCGWRSPMERRRVAQAAELGIDQPWWERRMVAFDLETTGPDPEHARIVSAAVALVGGGQESRTWEMLVDPGVPIPPDATKVHGITDEMVAASGHPPAVALEAIIAALRVAQAQGCVVAIFNAQYDLTVLDRELARYGVDGAELLPLLLVVDPFVLDKHLNRYRKGERKLLALCAAYGVRLDGEHEAAGDAIAAARLAWAIGRRGQVVRRTRSNEEVAEFVNLTQEWQSVRADPFELFVFQRHLAYADALDLEEYFRWGNAAKGVPAQPDRVVPKEWPIIPR